MDAVLVGPILEGVENHSLAVLSAALRDNGHRSQSVAFSGFTELESALSTVLSLRPRVCGISMQSTESALASLVLARMLRMRGYTGKIVCGGHFATLNAEDILDSPAGVDVVVRFAGESTLVGLLEGRATDAELARLPGAVFRSADGSIRTGAAPRVASDTFPKAPARRGPLPRHLGFPAADLVSSRGCEARCAYCCVGAMSALEARELEARAEPAPSRGYARREAGQIAGEIAMLHHEHGARVFNFMDDNLLPLERGPALRFLAELRRALHSLGVGRIAFSLQLRADLLDDEVADALVEAGLVRAYVGIDAASAGQLRALGRRSPAEAGQRALTLLAERGVFSVCNALLIGPTFGFDSVRAEIDALSAIRHAPLHLLPIDVRAGTPYYARAERRGLLEGGFLFRRFRFTDERTGLLGRVVTALPTRLEQRSVPIALYDLGYNLGIAKRLCPGASLLVERLAARYARIAEAWNRDQIRVLSAAADAAATRSPDIVEALILRELPRVTAHDTSLLAECDRALSELEARVSRELGEPVHAHARGRLLSVALAMTLAACGGDVEHTAGTRTRGDAAAGAGGSAANATGGVFSTGGASASGGAGGIVLGGSGGGGGILIVDASNDGFISTPSDAGCTGLRDAASSDPQDAALESGLCPDGTPAINDAPWESRCGLVPGGFGCGGPRVVLAFDANGMLTSIESADPGVPLDYYIVDCLKQFLGSSCYPSLACTRQSLGSHCWVA